VKKLILLSCLLSIISFSQDNASNWTVQLSATVVENPASITLNWEANTASGDTYVVFRKLKGASGWGSSIAQLTSTDLSYTDNNVTVGESYEYLVQKVQGGSLYSWGYINAGIKTELDYNKGDILLVVDSTFIVSLSAEIQQLEEDLYRDGWMVTTVGVNPNATPVDVKAEIQNQYNTLSNLRTVYLLGHVPVPYSGNLYPDAHTDHEGAWPADVYYADLDGNWTDITVNNTVASDSRNDNIPGDGKFDQSKPPTTLELEICRVDFHDLPVYTETEEELLQSYLNRAHDFKIGAYVPQEKALYDQGGFTGMQEGFAQNGLRNFAPFVGPSNIGEVDYFTSLTTESYLWSYGCGAGSYTSAGALDNGSSLTSAELAGTPMEAVFTMVFGSYFGDWDRSNNFMRSVLANGKTLSVAWAGRPNFHYHTMAKGDHLGASALMSMDLNTDYLSLSLGSGFVTGEGVHVAQFGDPSLRTYYVEPPSNLMVTNNNNDADLSWVASTDVAVDGYNIYRRTSNSLWTKVNTSIVTGTTFTDNTLAAGDDYEYMVRAVKLKTNGSGTFYNESLGTTDTENFTVGIVSNNLPDVRVFPVPAVDLVEIQSNADLSQLTIYTSTGQLVRTESLFGSFIQLDVSDLSQGLYLLQIDSEFGTIQKRLIKQ
jgi:hypothetical protein